MWETRANQFLDDVTPDGFKISLDVGKFLLCLHFWGENFRTGPFLSLLTSRWRSSHSIPGFSPHTCQKMVQMVPHSPSEKALTKRTVVHSLPFFPLLSFPPPPLPSFPLSFSSSPLSVPSVLLSTIACQVLKQEGQRWWNPASRFIQQQSSLCIEMSTRQF